VSRRPMPDGILKLTPDLMPVATLLLGLLVRNAKVFEFGSGGSTLWLARRVRRLLSIEDSAEWFSAVLAELHARRLGNVEIQLVPTEEIAAAIDGTGEWDLIFVDCRDQNQRVKAIMRARKHIVVNGWLVADDCNFPRVARAIDKLRASNWNVVVMSGVKIHPVTNQPVKTATAFCRKLK